MTDEPLQIIVEIAERDGDHTGSRKVGSRGTAQQLAELQLGPDSPLVVHDQPRQLRELLDALLAYTGQSKAAGFDQLFDERGQQDFGVYLHDQLFPGLTAAEAERLDKAPRVDLTLVLHSPYLARIPWVLLVRNNAFLATRGWTISLAYDRQFARQSVDFPHAPTMVIAAPNPFGDTQADEHLEELLAALQNHHPQLVEGQKLTVARTWSELRDALVEHQPHVLYYYGHAKGDAQTARLIFADPQTGSREVPVADLAACLNKLPHRPLLAYLNCCHGDAGGALGAGGQLAGLVPAVVSNRTRAFVRQSRLQAKRFFQRTLLFGTKPHEAVGELYGLVDEDEFTLGNPRWMTPVCYRGYGEWAAPVKAEQGWVPDPDWRDKLDRELQFPVVFEKTHGMLTSGAPRGLAFLWYGHEGHGLDRFHRRLTSELSGRLGQDIRLREYRPSWPDALSSTDPTFSPQPSFIQMYHQAFEVSDLRDIPRTVRLQSGADCQKTLVYIRHRVIREQESFQHRFLKDYLLWFDSILPTILGTGQYALLGVSYQADRGEDPDAFARTVKQQLKLEHLAYRNTRCRLLLRFGEVDETHLREFMDAVGFPLPIEGRAEFLEKVGARSHWLYDAIILELETWLRKTFQGR